MPLAPRAILRLPTVCAALFAFALGTSSPPCHAADAAADLAAADLAAGERIYRDQCAACHGDSGEGTDEFAQALVGDRGVASLARLIDETMPKGSPEDCSPEESQAVAAYIHQAFYSADAQARLKPPRVELSRLTVRQYQNAITDLVGSFRPPGKLDAAGKRDSETGLRGEYFNNRRFRDRDRLLERVDPEVRLDFGTSGPTDKFNANEFSIRWEGSVIAPDTGHYDFTVRTEHATRLWINDLREPLVDAWVQSGDDTEHRGSIYLLGGRAYSVKLEFSKATQGVNDEKRKKERPAVKATVALLWQRPHRPAQVIPRQYLSPVRSPERFVTTTQFPPDDRSVGYERGTFVSKAWTHATNDAAVETANYVTDKVNDLAGTSAGSGNREAKLREFCLKFAERAFRRPLSSEDRAFYIDQQFARAANHDSAVKRVAMLVLKSPRFLFRDVGQEHASYHTAARLSFGLWDSLPDAPLLEAAAKGELETTEQVAQHAQRMTADPRFRAKLADFLLHWLGVDTGHEMAKDASQFPEFTPELAADLRTSLELSLADAAADAGIDLKKLLLGSEVYVNGPLAKFYGVDKPAEAPFERVALEANERGGLVAHPYLMARYAYTATSSPIHRGVFLSRHVLGRLLRPPPEAVSPLSPDLHPDLTTRDRVILQTGGQACIRCHGMINSLGFALEHFDAVGRYRTEDKGKPVDDTGSYEARSGEVRNFAGGKELAAYLADSEDVHAAFVEDLFHHLAKQPARAFGAETLPRLEQHFREENYNIHKLVVAAITASAVQSQSPASLKAPEPN